MAEKEKASDKKAKRFEKNIMEIFSTIFFSMATAILVHIWLMH